MTTTLLIDKNIRDKASLRAKKEKLSVSSVARILLSEYAEWNISIWAKMYEKSTYNTQNF